MPEIRALIVDDEPLARRGIRQMLASHPDVVVTGECRDGREAVRAIQGGGIDLVFLDVELPQLDGFGVIRQVGAAAIPPVIFVTAYDHFAVRAFDALALDYLVKPLTQARFDQALERARARRRTDNALDLATRLGALLANDSPPPRPSATAELLIETATGAVLVPLESVDWIGAVDAGVVVHAGQAQHRAAETLQSLEERLDRQRFVRVHRGAIARLGAIREVRDAPGGGAVAVLRNGTQVPVSRRRRDQLVARLRALAR